MATAERQVRGFASPFEVPVPEGCEGWESMYPYYALFSDERRGSEEARGWFRERRGDGGRRDPVTRPFK